MGLDLPLTLVVRNTLCLRCPGLLGCEGQHHQGDDIRQHPIHMGTDADFCQPVHTVPIDVQAGIGCGDALEQAKEQGCSGDVQRFPVAEDHNRQRQEAEAGHIAVGAAVGSGVAVGSGAAVGSGVAVGSGAFIPGTFSFKAIFVYHF